MYAILYISVKLLLFSHLKERIYASIWMTLFFVVLFALVYCFQGSKRIAYVVLSLFVLGCLVEWGYACFCVDGWKKYYMWPLGSIFIIVGGLSFLAAFNTKGWTSWIIIVASSILTDTFAYFFGSWLKGPKIFPRISPSKTYSGTLGSLIMAPICTMILGDLLHYPINWVGASVLNLFAQVGDFLESWAKRHLEIKDVGHWIKGHGGAVDRTDSWWMAAIGYGIEPWI